MLPVFRLKSLRAPVILENVYKKEKKIIIIIIYFRPRIVSPGTPFDNVSHLCYPWRPFYFGSQAVIFFWKLHSSTRKRALSTHTLIILPNVNWPVSYQCLINARFTNALQDGGRLFTQILTFIHLLSHPSLLNEEKSLDSQFLLKNLRAARALLSRSFAID